MTALTPTDAAARFTQGPWTATQTYPLGDWCIHAKGIQWQLAYVPASRRIDWPLEANARLIAAAPDLYAALVETLEIATRNEEGDFADRARAALAKANPHSLPFPSQATDMAGAEFPPLAAPATLSNPPFAAPAMPHTATPSSESPEGEAQSLSGTNSSEAA